MEIGIIYPTTLRGKQYRQWTEGCFKLNFLNICLHIFMWSTESHCAQIVIVFNQLFSSKTTVNFTVEKSIKKKGIKTMISQPQLICSLYFNRFSVRHQSYSRGQAFASYLTTLHIASSPDWPLNVSQLSWPFWGYIWLLMFTVFLSVLQNICTIVHTFRICLWEDTVGNC